MMTPHDPNECIWQRYFAALLQSCPPDEARRRADKALSEHCERWPRERRVVPKQEVDDQIDQERCDAARKLAWVIQDACNRAESILASADRQDAAHVVQTMGDHIVTHCLTTSSDGRVRPASAMQFEVPKSRS